MSNIDYEYIDSSNVESLTTEQYRLYLRIGFPKQNVNDSTGAGDVVERFNELLAALRNSEILKK